MFVKLFLIALTICQELNRKKKKKPFNEESCEENKTRNPWEV